MSCCTLSAHCRPHLNRLIAWYKKDTPASSVTLNMGAVVSGGKDALPAPLGAGAPGGYRVAGGAGGRMGAGGTLPEGPPADHTCSGVNGHICTSTEARTTSTSGRGH
jgi:hypothetical protein